MLVLSGQLLLKAAAVHAVSGNRVPCGLLPQADTLRVRDQDMLSGNVLQEATSFAGSVPLPE